MWRVRQVGNHWVVLRPDGVALTAAGAPIAADGPDALVAAAGGQLHPGTREGYIAAVSQVAVLARPHLEAMVAAAGDPGDNGMPTWEADAVTEGEWTSDGRIIAEGACTWREPPLPLMFQDETEIGHFGAVLAGWAATTERRNSTIVMGGGFDQSDAGRALVEVLQARGSFGVSVDIGDGDAEVECSEYDDDGWCTDITITFTAAELIGLTATPFPAQASAHMRIDGEASTEEETEGDGEAAMAAGGARRSFQLVAAGFPDRPPAAWFADPAFSDSHDRMEFSRCADTGELTPVGVPLTVTDDGQVFGHLFAWGTCHTGYPQECVTPPSSPTQYAYFRTGAVVCDDASEFATGVVTMGVGHADLPMSAREAQAHYDDSRYGVADVTMGEDGYGAWFAGALRPTVTSDQVRALRALSLSGDWRTLGGQLDLIAALAVNHPGFPILRNLTAAAGVPETAMARPQALVASGRPTALVSAGVVPNRGDLSAHRPAGGGAWAREIERRVELLDARTRPLVAASAQALRDRVAEHRR